MRKLFIFLITILGVAFITSCKKDEVKTVLGTNITVPVISAGVTSGAIVVLNKANKNDTIKFVWSAAYFRFKASITYTLQMDKKGNNFASALSLGSPTSTVIVSPYTLPMVTNDLNNKLLTLQADPENPLATAVEFRVMAKISDSVPAVYSPVISATYTPYYIAIVYPKVYVPGGYQAASGYTTDWAPDKAPFLASIASDAKYEGFVYFNAASAFKITSQQDWNGTNYGAGATSGTISTTGGDITTPPVGYYKINVNTTDLTCSLLKTAWSIIGSVNAPYDWSSDLDLTYNPATKVWAVTANLKAGEFKFRSNHDWALGYGSVKAPGKLDTENNNNIKIAADGNYTITLDFSVPPIYRYSAVKN